MTTNAAWPTANDAEPGHERRLALEQQGDVAEQPEHRRHHERGAGRAVDRSGGGRQRHEQQRSPAAWSRRRPGGGRWPRPTSCPPATAAKQATSAAVIVGARSVRRRGRCGSVCSHAHSSSTWASRWARSPPLSITRSAPGDALLAGDLLGDAGPARRPRPSPRNVTSRSTATSVGTSTTMTAANSRPGLTLSNGVSSTTTRSVSASASMRRAISSRTAGWTMLVEVLQGGVVVERDRRQRRPVELAVGPDDHRRRSARRGARAAACPACCSSLTMASASTITAPRAASIADTVDLPEPMPPVRATNLTRR